MNDKIRITGKLIDSRRLVDGDNGVIEVSRADLEALLAKPVLPKLVKGAVCRFTQSNGDVIYYDKLTNETVLISTRAEPLDWETLGYTIAQNYPEANWFAVETSGISPIIWYFEDEPTESISNWICDEDCWPSSRVTLPPGVDWRTTKRRIERI